MASAWAWYAYTSSLRNQAIASSFTGVKSILGTALERDSDLLATVNAEVATHPGLTNPTLTAILSKLDLSQRYPGSFTFTYVESVGNSELSDFESTAQRDPPLGMHQSASAVVKPSLNGRSGYCLTRLVAVELLGEGILKHVLMAWLTPYVFFALQFLRFVVRGSTGHLREHGRLGGDIGREPSAAGHRDCLRYRQRCILCCSVCRSS